MLILVPNSPPVFIMLSLSFDCSAKISFSIFFLSSSFSLSLPSIQSFVFVEILLIWRSRLLQIYWALELYLVAIYKLFYIVVVVANRWNSFDHSGLIMVSLFPVTIFASPVVFVDELECFILPLVNIALTFCT